ncbi:MAG: FISUMP domain-containing protein [Bacteroidota bacterium]
MNRIFLVASCLLSLSWTSPHSRMHMGEDFIDRRDGQTYETVAYAGLRWMAENLRYETAGSFCYRDSAELCQTFGRLYPFEDAFTACPEGWRLPTPKDWRRLRRALETNKADGIIMPGWWEDPRFDGATNETDLSILPAGRRDEKGPHWRESKYAELGVSASFWLDDPKREKHWHIRWGKNQMHKHDHLQDQGRYFSIRCVCEPE